MRLQRIVDRSGFIRPHFDLGNQVLRATLIFASHDPHFDCQDVGRADLWDLEANRTFRLVDGSAHDREVIVGQGSIGNATERGSYVVLEDVGRFAQQVELHDTDRSRAGHTDRNHKTTLLIATDLVWSEFERHDSVGLGNEISILSTSGV
ncbi:hypothetical protein D3C73_1087110 [compost metagenome]